MNLDDATPVISLGNSWFANTQNSDRDASWFASPCPRSCKVSVFFWFQHLSSSRRQHVNRYLQGVEVEEVEDAPPEEPPVPLLDDELKLADSRFEAWKSEVGKRGCQMDLSYILLICCCLLVKPFPLYGAGKVAEMKCLCRFLPTSSNCPSTSCPKGQTSSDAMRFSF